MASAVPSSSRRSPKAPARRSRSRAPTPRTQLHERIARQRIGATGEIDTVARFGAIQAQDYYGCLWALGLRTGLGEGAIEAALDRGDILRVHNLRGTWQLVDPRDVRMLARIARPRIATAVSRRHRELGLDAASLNKALSAVVRDIEKNGHRTRAELAAALNRAAVSPDGQRLSHILIHAELEELIVSGVRRGKQNTWALVDDRVPASKNVLGGEAAHAELARRYFASRGPATADDFAWFSGLPLKAARAAAATVELDTVDAAPPQFRAHLLPPFDEYLVGYRDRSAVLDPAEVKKVNAGGGLLAPVVVVDGNVIGRWTRSLGKKIDVAYTWFSAPPAKAMRAELDAAEARWRAFLR